VEPGPSSRAPGPGDVSGHRQPDLTRIIATMVGHGRSARKKKFGPGDIRLSSWLGRPCSTRIDPDPPAGRSRADESSPGLSAGRRVGTEPRRRGAHAAARPIRPGCRSSRCRPAARPAPPAGSWRAPGSQASPRCHPECSRRSTASWRGTERLQRRRRAPSIPSSSHPAGATHDDMQSTIQLTPNTPHSFVGLLSSSTNIMPQVCILGGSPPSRNSANSRRKPLWLWRKDFFRVGPDFLSRGRRSVGGFDGLGCLKGCAGAAEMGSPAALCSGLAGRSVASCGGLPAVPGVAGSARPRGRCPAAVAAGGGPTGAGRWGRRLRSSDDPRTAPRSRDPGFPREGERPCEPQAARGSDGGLAHPNSDPHLRGAVLGPGTARLAP
jgi:hypothetical protein